MAKNKLSLSVSPTFKHKVLIPVAGSRGVDVEFVYKHRTRDAFKDFVEGLPGREDVDVILDIASGWDLDESFDPGNIEELTQNHIGSARVIIEGYINELTNARLGN